ncbi:retention module-containing protein [Vibrio anguillarum]|uniref:retention module-containing protein n=1 Tax=Vibrio anguillarum TaxID=55601 RepID=UPI001695D811|nr:retention module-containing protein [Vibrio anguillarum]MCC4237302.1 retention module-containing protein [Vibrio anguillarum]MDT3847141.1 retention module-containing protein [Vibrio anguillarum]NOI04346.1 retention module-containing protein [Vibrio anguillarum]
MDLQVVVQPASVSEVVGDVIAVDAKGNARQVTVGDSLMKGEILITVNHSSVTLFINGQVAVVEQNCVACFGDTVLEHDTSMDLIQFPVAGDINADLTQLNEANFDADNIAAIQQAILDGQDPTQILEATAAGAGGEGSANAGFITIDYNFAEVLASTFFETAGRDAQQSLTETNLSPLRFTAGGESLSAALVEGSLSLNSYPQSVTANVLIAAGDLPLDAASFVPESLSLAALLSELNSDITSAGRSVSFRYDATANHIVGELDGSEVLRIDLVATSVGKDINLEIVTTISQPIDHVPSVGGGLVSFANDQIAIQFDVTGSDAGGNPIRSPISIAISIGDGNNPVMSDEPSTSVYEDNLANIGSDASASQTITVSGQFDTQLGSDQIESYQLDLSANPLAGLTSAGVAVQLASSSSLNGVYTYQASANGQPIFELILNPDGRYQFTLQGALDHPVNSDELLLNLSVLATDYDGDSSESVRLPINIIDDKPEIIGVDALSVDEDDLASGSDSSKEPLFAEGVFTTQSADKVVSYQLDTSSNPLAGLTSQGEAVSLGAATIDADGNYHYQASAAPSGNAVFSLVLNADGSYRFTLQGPVDHAQGSDELLVNFKVVATDYDGDSANILLPVTIHDDQPIITGVQALSVDEDDLTSGSDSSKEPLFAEGMFTTQSADKVVSYQLDTSSNPLAGLTSQGEAVILGAATVDANGNYHYQASTTPSGNAVFSLVLNADGSYRFTLQGPIDHAAGSDERLVNFNVVATDYDGDASASDILLPVTIVDDKPTIVGIRAGSEQSVDEDDLATIGSDRSDSTVIAGHFDVIDGADGIVSYQVSDLTTPVKNLTSGGQEIEIIQISSSNGVTVYEAVIKNTTDVVFRLTLNGSADSYQFELLKAIDHPTGNGENSYILDLPITATDRDGDVSASASLPISIVDDIPTLHDKSITSVENTAIKTVNLFSQDNNTSPDTQGADHGAITKFVAVDEAGRDIQFRDGNGASLANEIELNGITKTVTVVEIKNGVERDLGTLTITPNGNATFKPVASLEHGDDPTISFTVDVTAQDFDGDASTEQLNINILDRNATITVANVIGAEDAGRDGVTILFNDPNQITNSQDNQSGLNTSPLKVDLQINLYDLDRNESIGDVKITGSNAHGDFYYLNSSDVYVKLELVSGRFVLPADAVEQSLTGSVAKIENLYFVPDRHYASANGGFQLNITVQVLNNGLHDHNVNGKLRIEVESVADIATWTSSSQFHYDAVEDSDNITLDVLAQTQDNSTPETILYEIRFTQGEGEAQLVYADGTPVVMSSDASGHYYLVSASNINQVQVDPNDNFSGQIKLDITAITTEQNNAHVGKESARSETKEIVIDVSPVADMGSFSVNRINVFEDNAATQNTVDPTTDHDPLLLSEVITMAGSVDSDGSETLYVRLSDFSETGVTLIWLGAGASEISQITDANGHTYYEVPEQYLDQVEVLPPLHSNADFTFSVEGIIKDSVTLSTGAVTDEISLGVKAVNVSVKGVADIPTIDFHSNSTNTWNEFSENGLQVIETTIDENQSVGFGFSVLSGELADNPTDSSESITVLLSNIPDGVKLYDSVGSVINLVFVGYDTAQQPIYQANLTSAQVDSGIRVEPSHSSTENINIKMTTIVTENDGHTRQIESEIRIKVAPVIDVVDNYQSHSLGNEDSRINIHWQPEEGQHLDADEYFASVTLSGFPAGSTIYVDGVVTTLDSDGKLILTPALGQSDQDFSAQVLTTGYVQVQPPEHSSTDFTLSTEIVVKEQDNEYVDAINSGEGIASKVIHGSVDVTVRPIVEADGQLRVEDNGVVTNKAVADASGAIYFTINDAAGGEPNANVIRFDNADTQSTEGYQSLEVVDQLVVRFSNITPQVLDQLLITGAINNGDGSWTIVDEQNFSVKAPNGLTLGSGNDPDGDGYNDITVTIFAQVYDQGEDSSEAKVVRQVQSELTLQFPLTATGNNTVAADITLVGNADDIVLGIEDNAINLGQQIQDKLMVSASGFDGVEDELSIVIAQSVLPAGASLSGGHFDFVDGLYVYKGTVNTDGSISGLENLHLHLPEDYAGDFNLPITFVTTDTASGDEKTFSTQIPVAVSPVADVPGTHQPQDDDTTPKATLAIEGTLGLDANHQPTSSSSDVPTNDGIGYEDGIIHLSLDIDLADIRNSATEGQEVLSEVTLTLQGTNIGTFVDGQGNDLGTSITFSQPQLPAALDNVYFKPAPNYPTGDDDNTVNITVAGKVTDITQFDDTNANALGVANTDAANTDADKPFTTQVSFDVTPVVDDVIISSGGSSDIEVSGLEDEWIVLSKPGSEFTVDLTDTDGSEVFVSIKLTGVPTDFVVSSLSSDYTVKNNGGGEWSIQVNNPAQTSINLSDIAMKPAKNFSGEVEIGIKVFTEESLLGVPVEHNGSFRLDITPVGDVVDVEPVTNGAGDEGDEGVDIEIDINAQIIDKADSIAAGTNHSENSPETLRIEVSGVPDGASIALPDGTLGTYIGGGVWLLNADAQSLDKLIFNSGDWHKDTWAGDLTIKVQSVDTGLDGTEHLGPAREFTVSVDVQAVNDAPTIDSATVTTTIDEEAGQKVTGLSVSDVDYAGSHANDPMTVILSVSEGLLSAVIPALSSVTQSTNLAGELVLQGTLLDINALLNSSDPASGVFVDATAIGSDHIDLTIKANDGGVYADNVSGMALEETETVSIAVTPKANTPILTLDPSFNYMKQTYVSQSISAQGIALLGVIAALTDSHEVLSLEIDSLPSGATLSSSSGSVTEQNGVWIVSADAIDGLQVSGLDLGQHTLSVAAISTETDGSRAASASIDIAIEVLPDGSTIDQSTNGDDAQLLAGNVGAQLLGGSGHDHLEGGDGDDSLVGGGGNDTLIGGLGADILTGGSGADIFKWTLDTVDEQTDTITDFNAGEGDVIDLTDVVADLHLPMDQLLVSLHTSHQIEAKVMTNTTDVELEILTDNNVHQTIVVQDLASQFNFDGMASIDIVGFLLDNNIIKHDV